MCIADANHHHESNPMTPHKPSDSHFTGQTSKGIPMSFQPDLGPSEDARPAVERQSSDPDVRRLLHRRAAEIFNRIRCLRARLTNRRDQLLFDYIVDNTIGRGKASDQISNSQFTSGKRCRKTGQVIDFGCHLKSINTVRAARKSLVGQGMIFEEAETDESGARSANRYGLAFIRDLLSLEQDRRRTRHLRQHTPSPYQPVRTTNKLPKEVKKQRCRKTTWKSKQQKHHMDSEHVDYLIGLIEQATGDKQSRGAWAQLAMTVDEGQLMELISILKDRNNIRNKGAWFWAAAQKYRRLRVIRADDPAPPPARLKTAQPIPTVVSYKAKLQQMNRQLADKLGIPPPAIGQ